MTLKNLPAKFLPPSSVELAGIHLNIGPSPSSHRNFILSTWVKSWGETNRVTVQTIRGTAYPTRREQFERAQGKVSERLWEHSFSLSSKDNPAVCHGWLCLVGPTLVWAYIPHDLRRMGLFSVLRSFACEDVEGLQLASPWPYSKGIGIPFNPSALLEALMYAPK